MFNKSHKYVNCDTCKAKDTSLFSSLCPEGIDRLNNDKTCSFYKKNQPLFIEGSYPRGVFCINSGKIKVFSTGESGKEQIIRIATEGDVVGFRALFSEEPYKLSATTLEESNICFIEIDSFLSQVNDNSGLLQSILKELSKESGERADFIKTMAQKTVKTRLAIVLLVLDDIYKDDMINLSRDDLANFVGTATETLIRLLKEFREEGLIAINGRKIQLLKTEKIYREASY